MLKTRIDQICFASSLYSLSSFCFLFSSYFLFCSREYAFVLGLALVFKLKLRSEKLLRFAVAHGLFFSAMCRCVVLLGFLSDILKCSNRGQHARTNYECKEFLFWVGVLRAYTHHQPTMP